MPKYRVWQNARVSYTIVVEADNKEEAQDLAFDVDLEDWVEADFDTTSIEVDEVNE